MIKTGGDSVEWNGTWIHFIHVEIPPMIIMISVNSGKIADVMAFKRNSVGHFEQIAFPNQDVAYMVDKFQGRLDAEAALAVMDGKLKIREEWWKNAD